MDRYLKQSACLALMMMVVPCVAQAATQILTLNESERLTANIAIHATNRVAVLNDRIVNIFGDEGTFVTQNDEHSGQVFIKVTSENGDKPLSLTLSTENGLTQDLSLIPSDIEASTLLLKVKASTTHPSAEPFLGPRAHTYNRTDRLIQLMKQAVLGELPTQKESSMQRRKHAGIRFHYQKTYQAEDLKIQHWTAQNTSKVAQELLEKNVYERGDIALSLQKTLLKPGEKTNLYILRH